LGVGLRGQMGIYEMLTVNAAIRGAVERGAPAAEIVALAVQGGMSPMAMDGLAKARLGLTTLEEVARVATVIAPDADETGTRVAA
jgi:type II secretory ATPase GspE/PulE/Tfp pilus assembly ATPase PilB-like protein